MRTGSRRSARGRLLLDIANHMVPGLLRVQTKRHRVRAGADAEERKEFQRLIKSLYGGKRTTYDKNDPNKGVSLRMVAKVLRASGLDYTHQGVRIVVIAWFVANALPESISTRLTNRRLVALDAVADRKARLLLARQAVEEDWSTGRLDKAIGEYVGGAMEAPESKAPPPKVRWDSKRLDETVSTFIDDILGAIQDAPAHYKRQICRRIADALMGRKTRRRTR